MAMPRKDDNNLDVRLQELLAEQADALIAGNDSFEPRFERFNFNTTQETDARDLLQLASHLRETLLPVGPSPEFMSRLKGELTGEAPVTLLVRWRKLPASYQLAAKLGGLTITAGLVLIAAKRGLNVLEAFNRHDGAQAEGGLSLTAG
jgi:hypothetical protein